MTTVFLRVSGEDNVFIGGTVAAYPVLLETVRAVEVKNEEKAVLLKHQNLILIVLQRDVLMWR